MNLLHLLFLLVVFVLGSGQSYAQDEAEAAAEGDAEKAQVAKERSTYMDLKPPFVANFGGTGRLRYIKTEVTLRVISGGERAVMHHMPAIRHTLLMLFSRQPEEGVTTMEGKELLRQDALQAVQNVLAKEEGDHNISDLLFGSFIVQRH